MSTRVQDYYDTILPTAIEKLHADDRYQNAIEHAPGFPTAMDVAARLMFEIVEPQIRDASRNAGFIDGYAAARRAAIAALDEGLIRG